MVPTKIVTKTALKKLETISIARVILYNDVLEFILIPPKRQKQGFITWVARFSQPPGS